MYSKRTVIKAGKESNPNKKAARKTDFVIFDISLVVDSEKLS